jgi:hypothetical protein
MRPKAEAGQVYFEALAHFDEKDGLVFANDEFQLICGAKSHARVLSVRLGPEDDDEATADNVVDNLIDEIASGLDAAEEDGQATALQLDF